MRFRMSLSGTDMPSQGQGTGAQSDDAQPVDVPDAADSTDGAKASTPVAAGGKRTHGSPTSSAHKGRRDFRRTLSDLGAGAADSDVAGAEDADIDDADDAASVSEPASVASSAQAAASKVASGVSGTVSAAATRVCETVSSTLNVSKTTSRVISGMLLACVLALSGVVGVNALAPQFKIQQWTDYDECIYKEAEESSHYGAGEESIPDGYGDTYTYTEYEHFNWTPGTNQRAVFELWKSSGSVYTDHIATINGRYLIATTKKFGTVGDQVDFYLDDGTELNCIIADQKNENDANCNEWGHDGGRSLLEFEIDGEMAAAGKNPGQGYMEMLSGHRAASWTNLGVSVVGNSGSIVDGAASTTSSSKSADAAGGMSDCAKHSTSLDNSTAAAAMASLSYSKRVTYGEGYEGTEAWLRVYEEVLPGDNYPRSCDRGVATAVRWSGTDTKMDYLGCISMISYMDGSDRWECLGLYSDVGADALEPGDIIIRSGHVYMYVGHEIIEQIYENVVKGTDGDLGSDAAYDESYVYTESSLSKNQTSYGADARAPCFSCHTPDQADYRVYRCVNPENSDKYDDFDIAGMTSKNSSSIAACECKVEEQTNSTAGEDIAELAVYMAATALPDTRIQGPTNDPWLNQEPAASMFKSDKRLKNELTIVDATLKAWGGNPAYASCCQAACAVIAAAADPDIASSNGDGTRAYQKGDGGSLGPDATRAYCKGRTDLYTEIDDPTMDTLKPGDLLISKTHVMIYVGNEAAQKRFAGTTAYIYEASFNDGEGGSCECWFPGLTEHDLEGFTAFRIKKYNTSPVNTAPDGSSIEILDWESMVEK